MGIIVKFASADGIITGQVVYTEHKGSGYGMPYSLEFFPRTDGQEHKFNATSLHVNMRAVMFHIKGRIGDDGDIEVLDDTH